MPGRQLQLPQFFYQLVTRSMYVFMTDSYHSCSYSLNSVHLVYCTFLTSNMVKALTSKSSHAFKVAKPSRSVPIGAAVGTAGSSIDGANSSPPPNSDEEEFVDCSGVGVDSTSFDLRVGRCFVINDIGSVRKVPVSGVMKNVYNVMLITPLGESILLSAWQQVAFDLFDFFW